MKSRWMKGDTIPCAICGSDAVYRLSNSKSREKGHFKCKECGEKHYFLSQLNKIKPKKMKVQNK